MEIGNERINAFEFVARIDENFRPSSCSMHGAVFIRHGFQCTCAGGTNGDDSATAFFCIIDDISGFLSDLIILRMHMVLCHILHLNRTECAQAHMKGYTGDADALSFNGRQKFRCKMQSGCGCSGTAFMFGIDRLVTVFVLKLVGDIWRQRHFT